MSQKYQYFPPTGPLPGKSFELQTVEFFEGLQFDVDKNGLNIAALQTEQAAFGESVGRQIDSLNQKITDTAQALDKKIDDTESALAAQIATTETNLAERIAAVERTQTQQGATITAQGQSIAAHEQRITATEGVANQALALAREGLTFTLRGTRSSAGNWTITGCVVGRPLYVVTSATSPPAGDISAVSGAWGSGPVQQFIPTATTVVLTVPELATGTTLRAYQPGD